MDLCDLPIERYQALQSKLIALIKPLAEKPHTEWLPVRDIAKTLRLRQQQVEELVEDTPELDLCVGFKAGSGGIAEFDKLGDYLVEFIGQD